MAQSKYIMNSTRDSCGKELRTVQEKHNAHRPLETVVLHFLRNTPKTTITTLLTQTIQAIQLFIHALIMDFSSMNYYGN